MLPNMVVTSLPAAIQDNKLIANKPIKLIRMK